MPIARGDVVIAAVPGDYGKPRPAVIVQSSVFPDTHESIIICQMTSVLVSDVDFRITIEPSATNGLRARSQIMVDKPTTILRRRLGDHIGRLAAQDIARLDTALAIVFGLIG
jgi:mRNA interferase MazF